MTYIEQTKACSKCNFPVFFPARTGNLCGKCYDQEEAKPSLVPNLHDELAAKDREIAMLREQLSRPRITFDEALEMMGTDEFWKNKIKVDVPEIM